MEETKYVKIKDCYYYSIPNGRSYYEITCPFCNSEIKAQAWSLSSVGKKCENCKAKVTIDYFRIKEFKVSKEDLKGKKKNETK
nr:MAG TPA: DNA-directed RNA polymerase [Caudoviricetes sp.]